MKNPLCFVNYLQLAMTSLLLTLIRIKMMEIVSHLTSAFTLMLSARASIFMKDFCNYLKHKAFFCWFEHNVKVFKNVWDNKFFLLPTRKFRKYLLLCDTWMVQIKVEDPDPGHRERPFKGRGRGCYMCYTIWDQVEQASRESHKLLLCGKYKSPWKGLDLEHKIWKSRISRWDKFTMHLFFHI